MVRKSALLGLLGLLMLAAGMATFTAAPAQAKVQGFRIIAHARTYDVVRGHHRTFAVRHRRDTVSIRGVTRYEVVKRRPHSIILRKLSPFRSAAIATTGAIPGVPVSVGMPTFASSDHAYALAAAANDSIPSTRWAASSSRSYPQWWTVDLGVATAVSGVRIAWYTPYRAYRYRIDTGLDGVTYTTAVDRSTNEVKGATADIFTAVARYVRVTVVGVHPGGVAASAYEITVNGATEDSTPSTPEPEPPSTNDDPSPTTAPQPTPAETPDEPAPSPASTDFGCVKPVTTKTLSNHRIYGGARDVTYSHVRFEGVTGSSENSYAVVMMAVNSAHDADIANITFDHCVFATLPPGYFGNAFHMWNLSTTGKTIHHITFRDCWFEPQPRMTVEMNGRGGWWHDVTVENCTFEAGGGQMLSFDMSPTASDPVAPWGVNVGGVVRGVEGLHITNNDFRGTGVSVNGFTPRYTMGLEFGCVYPFSRDSSVGRSEFSGNRVGRCASAWFQCNRNGASYMTFADNLFDWGYNPGGISSGPSYGVISGTSLSHCTFRDNRYVLDHSGTANKPNGTVVSSVSGARNTFSGERWTKSAGSMSAAYFPFTDSTYTGCRFELPVAVRFPASASGSGCHFDKGHTGGSFK